MLWTGTYLLLSVGTRFLKILVKQLRLGGDIRKKIGTLLSLTPWTSFHYVYVKVFTWVVYTSDPDLQIRLSQRPLNSVSGKLSPNDFHNKCFFNLVNKEPPLEKYIYNSGFEVHKKTLNWNFCKIFVKLKLVKLVGSRLRNILLDSTSGQPQPPEDQLPSFLCRNAYLNVVVCTSKPDLNVGPFGPGFQI